MKIHARSVASILTTTLLMMGGAESLIAQAGPTWERRQSATEPRPSVFSSTHSVNLPTAETLSEGEILFEISHRFTRPIQDGKDALWGFDGGVFLRLGLSYAVTDAVMVGLTRSNLDDNLDLGIKARVFERGGSTPLALALAAGHAWNTEALSAPAGASTSQLHAKLIFDVGLHERIAVGLVPGIVTNPSVNTDGEDASFFVGSHGRIELNSSASIIGEWIAAPARGDQRYDGGSLGIELETGGHFFKVIVGNGFRLNPAQAYVGASEAFGTNSLRFGFNITRILR